MRQTYAGFKKKNKRCRPLSNINQDDQNLKDRNLQCDFSNIATLQNSGFFSHDRFFSAFSLGKRNTLTRPRFNAIHRVCSLSPGIFPDTVLETLLKIMISQLKKRVKAIFDK